MDEGEKQEEHRSGIGLRGIAIVLLTAFAVPIALLGWIHVYRQYFEIGAPVITVSDLPRGIGLSPVSFQLSVSDPQSGLASVDVRILQKSTAKPLLSQSFDRKANTEAQIELDGETLNLDETKGPATVEVVARDSTLWRNRKTLEIPFNVDFQKPHLQLLSSQVGGKAGGSGVLLFKAIDENSGVAGIRIGNRIFLADRASGLDQALADRSLNVVVYAIDDSLAPQGSSARIFVEDQVGNADSETVELRITPAAAQTHHVGIDEEFLRTEVAPLAEQNFSRLQEYAGKEGKQLSYQSSRGGPERLVEQFRLVTNELRELNQNELESQLRIPHLERYWKEEFLLPFGKPAVAFNDSVVYSYQGFEVAKLKSSGFEYPADRERGVLAANDGVVVVSESIGYYGRIVAIDHGLGIISLYGRLETVEVKKGQVVRRGDRIGTPGTTGFARFPQVYFELRVHNVPVDAREWGDAAWFYTHVNGRIDEAKRKLGLPVYRELSRQ